MNSFFRTLAVVAISCSSLAVGFTGMLAVLLVAGAACPALAQSAVTWSGVAPAASGTVGGTGTWNTSGQNWWNGTSGVAWSNSGNDTAVFAGTSGTVTLGGNITAGGLTFNTTGYLLNVGSGTTLTLGAASNVLSLNTGGGVSGTISGLVTGTGNVQITGGTLASGISPSTLNLIGTATGGWSGTTTIARGQTLALSATNQALRNTAAINLVNGNITVTSASTTAGLDRISNAATISVNTGSFSYTTVNNAANSAETGGSVALGRGEFVTNLSLTQSTGTQALTFGGLSRSGGSDSTASIRFIGAPLDTSRNRVVVTGASGSGTNSGQIIGPWATVEGDYAVYDGSGNVLAANITATSQTSWTTSTNAYTANTPQTLGATRSIAALRYSGTLAANTSGTALTLGNFNLETNGILAPVGGGTASTLSIVAAGSGVITTPTTSGNLFIATTIAATGTGVGTNRLRIDAPIIDNGSTLVKVVKTGPGVLELTGANTFSGGLVLNGGVLVAGTDSALGAASGGITVDGNVQIYAATGAGRTIQVNEGAVAGFYACLPCCCAGHRL